MCVNAVPDPPTGVNHIAFGTADIQLNWTEPTFDRLKGETPTYYVKLYSSNGTCTGSLQVDQPWVEVNASVGVTQGDSQEVAVSHDATDFYSTRYSHGTVFLCR